MSLAPTGRLHVVATPIGNLEDLSPRALRTLREADLIAAEDTRHTQALLSAFGVRGTLVSLHDHNEAEQIDGLLAKLRDGAQIALVSDAGTPLVSDPGFRLVRAAREAGIEVSPVPGACAAIAALSVAGLPSDRFAFEGFLPQKGAARRERLQSLAAEARTLVFYESSHRIDECLVDAAAIFGATRRGVVARELTKRFETVLDGPLGALAARVAADADQRRGEFVVIVEGATGDDADASLALGRRVHALLREHLPPSQAARLAAEISGAPRKKLYEERDAE
ncbi:16S rRNA (cytidine(1402)-2'-O)-methyltransferase [Chiayiivirga flava]|uniref:Ribosomal RNA small subunit methyltransferase I n=1 Tax=Chiayiivirga flava TaxID=659595 RepID=A0A7W8G048_9GAMM|nr:16S rRNA (cytidine(1402)-2'-O)-methyltransferase [Chiayiivirga flava]MBB5209137.1 16S rRNA (cytidine1402-2'-O)-methyltransferase [Chiayiivirga flava]